MHTILQCIHTPITKYTPSLKVYPLLQCASPITMCIPYYKVHTLSQNVSPITMCTPYHKVHFLVQGIAHIAKHTNLVTIAKCNPY